MYFNDSVSYVLHFSFSLVFLMAFCYFLKLSYHTFKKGLAYVLSNNPAHISLPTTNKF